MIFEALAYDDFEGKDALRKATVAAHARVTSRFAKFIESAVSGEDREARILLARDDIKATIAGACAEYEVDPARVEKAVLDRFLGGAEHLKDYQFKKKDAEDSDDEPDGDEDDSEDEDPADAFDKGLEGKEAAGSPDYYEHGGGGGDPDSGYGNSGDLNGGWDPRDSYDGPTRTFPCKDCGTPMERYPGEDDISCPGCGAEHNSFGQRLAPRSQWGEETGESLGDIYGPDPERMPGEYGAVRLARRPKMCPYHRELVDSSLHAGEPQYAAFAGAVGGSGHCVGGYDGTCNFKPAMVGQKYWDDRKNELEQARQQQVIDQQQFKDLPIPEEAPATPTDMNDGEGVTNINSELESAPSAIAETHPDAIEPMPMAASTRVADGANQNRQVGDWTEREDLPNHKNDSTTGLSDQPSPKMDKKRWKPNVLNDSGNLKPIKTDEGTAWPTRVQDVTSGPDYKSQQDDKNWREQTDSVADHDVDVTQGSEHSPSPAPVDGPYQWTDKSTQANPVTSAVDVEKNPIRDILEGGFLPQNRVDQIIAKYNQ